MLEFNSNLRDVLARLGRLESAGANLSPLMRVVRGILHDSVEENFARQGRPGWRPLAKRTIAKRTKAGTWPGKILQERGELAASVEPGSDRTSAWVATKKRHAKIHQYGGTIERAAFGGTVRLRTARAGALMRQGKGGAIFAKDRHKRARAVRFETGAFKITIPARPFFLLTDGDQDNVVSAAARFIASSVK